MTDSNLLHHMVHCARQYAINAGGAMMNYFRKPGLEVHTKINESDIVTIADKTAEQIIISGIRHDFPTHTILSEESGTSGVESKWRWVIDPLDGTTNFSEGLPAWAVSIGIEYEGEPVAGIVYAPYLGELFSAIKGEGAQLNGHPISCRKNAKLERAVVATGFPVDKNVSADNNMDNLERVLPRVRGIRRLGSAALDICYVAAGFLDGYWELNLHHWDVSAALSVLGEAGGSHTFFRSDRNISILAASPLIFPQLQPLLSTTPRL